MKKTYTSFEQIDQDLRIYRLQQQVAMESVKLSVHRVKTQVRPSNLIGGSAIATGKFLIGIAGSKILRKWLVKAVKK
jgi:hypothetical protein